MSLYRRKYAESSIAESKTAVGFPSLDYYEQRIVDACDKPETAEGMAESTGKLLALCSDLLERNRRTDPAYGLTPVGVSDEF